MKVVRYNRSGWFRDISFLAGGLLLVDLFFLLTDDVSSDTFHYVFTFYATCCHKNIFLSCALQSNRYVSVNVWIVNWPCLRSLMASGILFHDGVIKWKHFPRYWPFVRGNPGVTDGFPSQRTVARSFAFFFDLRLNNRLNNQSRRQWFETPWRSLWHHCDVSGVCSLVRPSVNRFATPFIW